MHVIVPQAETPVLAQCDVLVCGGGPAGVAAAIAAARHGAEVVLLERWPCVGGMGTAALVNHWVRSDREKLVIFGLVDESARRLHERGWARWFPRTPHLYETQWVEPEGI